MSLQEGKTITYDGFKTLARGMDSGRERSLIGADQAAFLINTVTREGFPRNRPGWFKLALTGDNFQLGRFQMASPYISANGSPYLVASIGGHIVRFDPINRTVDDMSEMEELVNPSNLPRAWFVQAENFLCIQDNSSIPLIFDGASLRRGRPRSFGGDEFSIGNVMEYNNGRLWVALPDHRTFEGGDLAYSVTGDASDVLKSTQNQFLTSGSFALPSYAGFITAMKTVAVQDSVLGQGPLIVFGQFGSGTVNAPFNVDEWQKTASPIASVGLLSSGPAGADAVVPVNGDLWYRAQDGIRTYMIARRDHGTWVNTPVSREMDRLLTRDDPYLLEFTSAVVFDNRLLTTASPFRANYDAVQYGVGFRGLSVLDFAPVSSMFERVQPTWQGLWNGVTFLQVLTLQCYGMERCFAFVLNDCHQIELWEISKTNIWDNLNDPIRWSIETRNMGFQDEGESLKQLVRTEQWLKDVVGTVAYNVKYRPDEAPFWQDLDSGTFCATVGMCAPPTCDPPQAPFPQYRPRKLSSQPDITCEASTNKQYRNGYEFNFQITLIGAGTISKFRPVATDVPEYPAEGCLSDQDSSCILEAGCEPNIFEYQTPNEC